MKTNKGIRTSTEMTHKRLLCITKVFITNTVFIMTRDFPGGTSSKETACQSRRPKRLGFNPWVGKIPWEGNGSPLQYSCLENPMDRGAWWAKVHRVAKSQTRLSNFTFTLQIFFIIFIYLFAFYLILFLLYNTVLVLPYIDINLPWVYMSSQSWTHLPPPSP